MSSVAQNEGIQAIVNETLLNIDCQSNPEVKVDIINALQVALRNKKEEIVEARAENAPTDEYLG